MRPLYVTEAVVLRSWSYGESDKIVSFLTRDHGKIRGIAKGAKRSRRRFVNTLEPFSLLRLRFQERSPGSLAFIQGCDFIEVFRHLTSTLERIACASYLVEVTDELTRERDESRLLFEHLRDGLIFLEAQDPTQSFLTFYELKLLRLSGYQPVLGQCRRCARARGLEPENRWRFSFPDGGLICESCSAFKKESWPVSVQALDALARIERVESAAALPPVPASAVEESREIVSRFIQFQINKTLKSAPFLQLFRFA